jgi:hypothetical protein
MDRRRCVVTLDRVDIRPSRVFILLPAASLILGLLLVAAVAFFQSAFPVPLVIVLALAAVVLLPLSGMGLLQSAVGATVVVDRTKQLALWRRGLLGVSVGTREMVPFSKIQHLEVEETAPREQRRRPRDVAQFEVTLLRTSGRRLRVGVVTVRRSLAVEGLTRARLVAEAIAGVAGKPVHVVKPRRRRPRVVRPHYVPSRR